MTRKERVKRAVEHRETDIVPYHVRFADWKLAAEQFNDADFDENWGNHFALCRPRFASRNAEGVNCEFGVPFDAIRTGQKTFIDEANLYSFPFPDPHDERLFEGIDENLARHSDRYAFFDLSATMFERAFSLRGFQQVLEDMYLNPEFLHKLFDRILEFDLACLEKGLAYPVDGVRFGDDWGTQNGLLMSPASWREFLKPRMKILIERCRKAGKTVMLHSCGNITDIIPDLIEIGLTIYETFQPEAMDVRKIKEEYGKDLSFWGGVSMQKVLAYGTPEEVVAEIEQKCELLGKDGGYICGPSHTVTVDVPLKNTLAMMQTLKNQKSR